LGSRQAWEEQELGLLVEALLGLINPLASPLQLLLGGLLMWQRWGWPQGS